MEKLRRLTKPVSHLVVLGLLVFIFIVLLITDILGFTNIFPFVKHPKR